jgi:acyl dehydratase
MQAKRQFTQLDQAIFASASGDVNPMHMDAIAARRTQAGAPVVHGMHTLLWLLDRIAEANPNLLSVAIIKVRLVRMIYVDEPVEAKITHLDERSLHAEVLADGSRAITVKAVFGQERPLLAWGEFENAPFLNPTKPCALSIDVMEGRSGKLRLPDPNALVPLFPHAAHCLGPRRVAALACSSYLVGMVMPGLHSIYTGLDADICEDDNSDHALFKVTSADTRFRVVNQDFFGGGLAGRLETFSRMPPIRQASLESIAQRVQRNEFAGTTALIIGGSRGLGEVTAKIIIAGGGNAIITYAKGRTDAEDLATELKSWGGNCKAMAYDVLGDSTTQLRALTEMPTHIYYYATPPIPSNKSNVFSEKSYAAFHAFYVTGFEHLLNMVLSHSKRTLVAFYPSSVAVEQPPHDMIEYAKAKEEGEKLCSELMAKTPDLNILTCRLPRMLTDLTATIRPVKTADPVAILLPLIRRSINNYGNRSS